MNRLNHIQYFILLLASISSQASTPEDPIQRCIRIFDKNLYIPVTYHTVPVDRSASVTGLFDLECDLGRDCDLDSENEVNDLGGVTISIGDRPDFHIKQIQSNDSFSSVNELDIDNLHVAVYRFIPVQDAAMKSRISYVLINDSTNYVSVTSSSDELWKMILRSLREGPQCNGD